MHGTEPAGSDVMNVCKGYLLGEVQHAFGVPPLGSVDVGKFKNSVD
jgi:hypothetical protein